MEFFSVLVPAAAYCMFLAVHYMKLSVMPVLAHESERIPASLVASGEQLVKSDCFSLAAVADISCMILASVLSEELIWQRAYPGVSTFYIIDAFAWIVSIKTAKMEFERHLSTHLVSRVYWSIACAVGLSRLVNPWYATAEQREYNVANFFLNAMKNSSCLVLTVYAWYIPKDTNDVAATDAELRAGRVRAVHPHEAQQVGQPAGRVHLGQRPVCRDAGRAGLGQLAGQQPGRRGRRAGP